MCNNPKTPWLCWADETEKTLHWFRADCKLWSCEECSQKRKTRVSARASRGVERLSRSGLHVDFITLTMHEQVRTHKGSIRVWRNAWPKLRRRVVYRNEEFHYGFFPERHKDGTLHTHLLATNTQDKRWWKDAARSCGLGYIVDIQPCNHGGAAAKYATKYLSKTMAVETWPKGFHRFRFSQRWPDVDARALSDVHWSAFLSPAHFDDEMRYWHGRGFRIVNDRTGEIA